MANKKSAKSKGYRKTVQKKPFLTKKEIIELVVILAVVALVVVLFNLFYDDGYLRAEEVQPRDLVSYVSSQITGRYVKLGEVNELPGFTLDESEEASAGARVSHTYLPEDENAEHIDSVSVAGSFNDASLMANNPSSVYALGDYEFTEVQTASIQGHDAYIYGMTYSYFDESAEGESEEAEDGEEPAPNTFMQSINCYVDVDDYSVCLFINRSGEDESVYLPDDQLVGCAEEYAAAFTIEVGEK